MNKDNSDIRHQQHNKMIKDIQTTVISQVRVYALLLTEYCRLNKVCISSCLRASEKIFRNVHCALQVHVYSFKIPQHDLQ